MDSEERDAYQAYLVRLWRRQCRGEWQWHASIESPHTGERQTFGFPDQLFAYLREQCEGQVAGAPEAQRR